jgi:phasin family protein
MEANMAEKPVVNSPTPLAVKKPEPVKIPLAAKPEPTKPVPVAQVEQAKSKPLPIAAKPMLAKPPIASKPSASPARVIPKPAPVFKPVITSETPITTAVPLIAPPTTEGKATVNETFTKIENNAQNFATDATTKVKAAMEKGTKGIAEIVEFSKGNIEAVAASGKIAAKGAEEIAKYATDYGRTSIEKANASAKQFAAIKSPTEFFQLQTEMAKSSLEAFVGEASKFGENYMKLLGEIAQPIQSRYALAIEKVKTAVAA